MIMLYSPQTRGATLCHLLMHKQEQKVRETCLYQKTVGIWEGLTERRCFGFISIVSRSPVFHLSVMETRSLSWRSFICTAQKVETYKRVHGFSSSEQIGLSDAIRHRDGIVTLLKGLALLWRLSLTPPNTRCSHNISPKRMKVCTFVFRELFIFTKSCSFLSNLHLKRAFITIFTVRHSQVCLKKNDRTEKVITITPALQQLIRWFCC